MRNAPTTIEPGSSFEAEDQARGGRDDQPNLVIPWATFTIVARCFLIYALIADLFATSSISSYFFSRDQLWCLAIAAVLGFVWVKPHRLPWRSVAPVTKRRLAALFERWGGVAVALVTLLGTFIVYHGFALSRDEDMAQFDASIFQHGQLLAVIPPEWRAFKVALEPLYVLPITNGVAWVSSYLPGNAAIRALFGALGATSLTGPVLAGLSVYLVIGIGRLLWPDRRDAALVAGLLLATSTQVLITAMTPYAMTAHLALDLLWLWLFLRGSRWDHIGAIGVGFVACGLHQIIFHPLFVGPFILQLWLMKRWRLAAVYTIAYAAIGLFWIFYWQLMLKVSGVEAQATGHNGAMAFVSQIIDLVTAFDLGGVDLMIKNLVRFIAWQSPLALPLAVCACLGLRSMKGPVVALAAGLGLTVVAMFILLPYQGHGWGYRYLHGLIGSFCLLGAQGWIFATRDDKTGAVWSRLAVTLVFAIGVMLPGRALEVESFVVRYARAESAIQHTDADIVVVDPSGMPFAVDLVRNDPFLRNRPLVMSLLDLDEDRLRRLCGSHRVAVFDRADGEALDVFLSSTAEEANESDTKPLRNVMRTLGCGIPMARHPG